MKKLLSFLLLAGLVVWLAASDNSLPKCFKDNNHDGICDNSQNAGKKCPKNCMTTEAKTKRQKAGQPVNGCAGCTGGDCSKCALFTF